MNRKIKVMGARELTEELGEERVPSPHPNCRHRSAEQRGPPTRLSPSDCPDGARPCLPALLCPPLLPPSLPLWRK